jgi:hypothetical protein
MPMKLGFSLPWFMFDLDNRQLITSRIVPGDISDSKDIILTEVPVPGLNYAPIMPAGGGNRKVSFKIPAVDRNIFQGNVRMLMQFEQLRNQVEGIGSITAQFNRMPKVLYCWGLHSIPLVYWVAKIGFTHKEGWRTPFGQPTFTDVEVELILDETDPLYQAEKMFRMAQATFGSAVNPAADVAFSALKRKGY